MVKQRRIAFSLQDTVIPNHDQATACTFVLYEAQHRRASEQKHFRRSNAAVDIGLPTKADSFAASST